MLIVEPSYFCGCPRGPNFLPLSGELVVMLFSCRSRPQFSQTCPQTHIPEEKRLLWLGVMFGMNFVANQVNETFDLKYKKDKK